MRNRLDRSHEPGSQLDLIAQSTFANPNWSSTRDVPLALFGPERYEPRYAYPLIVWLHSCHSHERELDEVMPVLSMQNYVACAPRGTHASEVCGRRFFWPQTRAAATVAEEVVFAAVAAASENFSINANRIFLAGFGSGGTMALRVGLRYPKQFAGAISICGAFPRCHQPLKNLSAARQLPVLWMYGQDSEKCGVDHICQTLPLLHAARLNASLRQYPSGDELLTNMLSDMNHWIMERVTNQPAAPEPTVEESFSRN